MNTKQQVTEVLEKVYYGEYATEKEARTDVNAALEFVETELRELIELKKQLDKQSASLLQQDGVHLAKLRAAHTRPAGEA